MATKIITKNSSTTTAIPTAADLVQGELAVNVTDKRLFTENASGVVVELGTNPSTLTVTGEITANGGIALGDNDKATFGAGDDLQIYHDGSNSYIADTGTGGLRLLADADTAIRSADNSTAKAIFGGDVKLYHSGNLKLATTISGIDVTGTATMDGLTVDGNSIFTTADNSAQITLISTDTDAFVGPQLNLWRNSGFGTNGDLIGEITFTGEDTIGSTNIFASISSIAEQTNNGSEDGSLHFNTLLNGTLAKRLSIGSVSSGGDISFYNTAGTTPKFFWDSSAESLGIGTSSPSAKLHVDNGSGSALFVGLANNIYSRGNEHIWQSLNNTSEYMRIDSAGNVGIGCTPASKLDLDISTNARGSFSSSIGEVGSGNFALQVTNSAGSALKPLGFRAEDIRFATGSSERMRIDASGNLGLGVVPSAWRSGAKAFQSGANKLVSLWEQANGSVNLGFAVYESASNVFNYTTTGDSPTLYSQLTGAHKWYTAPAGTASNPITWTEAMTLDASGNLLVSGKVQASYIYRSGADGSGLHFTTNAIYPTNESASISDGTESLGAAGYRFKDLWLSGGVYLGGTGAANKLDDYEEGYFTATMAAGTGTITLDPLYDEMAYTKVGRVVHVQGQVIVGSVSTPSGTLRLTGLPFAIAAMTDLAERTAATVHVQLLTGSLAGSPMAWVVSGTELRIGDFDGTTFVDTMADHIAAGTQIAFSLTYSTDA